MGLEKECYQHTHFITRHKNTLTLRITTNKSRSTQRCGGPRTVCPAMHWQHISNAGNSCQQRSQEAKDNYDNYTSIIKPPNQHTEYSIYGLIMTLGLFLSPMFKISHADMSYEVHFNHGPMNRASLVTPKNTTFSLVSSRLVFFVFLFFSI